MQERVEAKRARYAFNSLSELAQYVERTPKTWTIWGCDQSVKGEARQSWDLGAGYQKAWELSRFGWIDGARGLADALKAIAPTTPAPDSRTDFYGHRPHVPRYCAGAPDCMVRHVPDPNAGGGKVLTLIVPVNATAGVSAQSMYNFGAGVVAYINQLETSGVRVELYGMICSEVRGWRVAHTWRVKSADQPFDLAVTAFTLSHPAMFRRLGFALRERCAAPATSGYGMTVSGRVDDLINAPAGAVILNGMKDANQHAPTPEAGLAYVRATVERAMERNERERA